MKSPAFQLYVNDFLGSYRVSQMSGTEIGIYFLLLLLDWQESGFDFSETSAEVQHKFDRKRLAKWCRVDPRTFDAAWRVVGPCFDRSGSRLSNPRLELERVRQADWREKSSRGGKQSAIKRASTTLEPPFKPPFSTPIPEEKQQQQQLQLPSPSAAPKAGKPNWLTPYVDAYAKHVGVIAPSRLAKVVAPVREQAGDAAAIFAFLGWCKDPKRGKSVNQFLARWREYEDFAVMDEFGNLTERGESWTTAHGL